MTLTSEVATTAGPVRGETSGPVLAFRGIPYAAAPTGARRFRAPEPRPPWDGVLDATVHGHAAPQNPSVLETMLGSEGTTWDEDCLHLNVWTPAADGAARPVLVWIHGGAFVTGSGSTPWYDGTRLAGRDAVVVTLNYRLGALGFLHLDDLDLALAGSGNVGLLDQVAALEWVRDNIAGFGGDPANVTVFGESAGAMSVGTLLGLPAARGLFAKAILQSGACAHVHDATAATGVARAVLAALDLDEDRASELVDVPLDRLLAAQAEVSASHPFSRGLPFQPVVDGTVLPEHPSEAVAGGSVAGMGLLLGTTDEEMKLFQFMDPSISQLDEDAISSRCDAMFGPAAHPAPGHAVSVYRKRLAEATPADLWSAITTDRTFRIPAVRLAERQLAHTEDVYLYLFTYRSPALEGALGACHALEIPFVWDNLDAPGVHVLAGRPSDELRELAHATADAWVAFARSGRPEAAGLPGWPRYDHDDRATMILDLEPRVEHDPYGAERALWEGMPI